MNDKIKLIKAELDYIKSSMGSWVKFGDAYNYDMVLKTLDQIKSKIVEVKQEHFPEKNKV